MGFFSWETSDTHQSIANCYTKKCKPVYLLMPDGNHIHEKSYQGYGVFNGVDAYELLAKMNGEEGDENQLRSIGISLFFSDDGKKLPFVLKFSFDPNATYEGLPAAENCPKQGYFY